MGKARKSKESFSESLLNVPDLSPSRLQRLSLRDVRTPQTSIQWKRLRDKATTVLNDMWNDYKKSIAKAADPILSLVRPKGQEHFSSPRRVHQTVRVQQTDALNQNGDL